MADQQIFLVGDSITQGCWDGSGPGWADVVKAKLQRNAPILRPVWNLGVGGNTVADVWKRLPGEFAARNNPSLPTLFIFALGTNDAKITRDGSFKRTPEETEADVRGLLRFTEERKARAAFIGLTEVNEARTNPTPGGNTFLNANLKARDALIRRLAEESGATWIEVADVTNPADFPDGLHPGAADHARMAARILEKLASASLIEA